MAREGARRSSDDRRSERSRSAERNPSLWSVVALARYPSSRESLSLSRSLSLRAIDISYLQQPTKSSQSGVAKRKEKGRARKKAERERRLRSIWFERAADFVRHPSLSGPDSGDKQRSPSTGSHGTATWVRSNRESRSRCGEKRYTGDILSASCFFQSTSRVCTRRAYVRSVCLCSRLESGRESKRSRELNGRERERERGDSYARDESSMEIEKSDRSRV